MNAIGRHPTNKFRNLRPSAEMDDYSRFPPQPQEIFRMVSGSERSSLESTAFAPQDNPASRWHALAEAVLTGHRLTHEEASAVLASDDAELLDVLSAAYRVRRHFHGHRVRLNFLINAKSGLCAEDCAYCSQAKNSRAAISKYPLVDREQLLDGARVAAERKASTYCIVISGRGPSRRDLEHIGETVTEIKRIAPKLKICVSPGLLDESQAKALKAAGVDRINHNLNTSRRFYPQICSTHTYDQRLDTLRTVRAAGLEICSGGIVGMGETNDDVVDLALTLSEIRPESLPINFLIPIEGTALNRRPNLSARDCLRVLCLFRLACPSSDLRVAAGRELHLGPLQPMAMFAANSLFVGDYLTTKGQPPEEDYRMLEALGFEPEVDVHVG
ncbi:biotin synthase BioB [Thermostilla marina]